MLLAIRQQNSKAVTQRVTRSLVLMGDNEGCCVEQAVRGTQWRRYPVNNDGQAASRRHRKQWTRSPECLAGAAYLEL